MTVLDSTPRDQYTATSGQTVFPYTFEIAAAGDIKVLQNGTLINQGAGAGEYAVSGVGVDTGGNVTLVTGATTGDVLTIYRDMALERLTAYTNAGDFLAADVNNDFDRLWLALQQNGGDLDGRVLIAPNTDPTSIDMTIPDKATRLGKYLKFNDTTGNPEAGDIAGLYTSAGMNNYNFTGDGTTVNFTLGMEPGGENNTQVYIDGVYQQKDTYNVSGAVVQFSAAPPNLSTIEVMVVQVLPVGATTASQVSFTQAGSTYGRNVQLKLQESVSVKDFGAVGDGVTDDTAAIQAAIAEARYSSLILEPNKTYKVTSALVVQDLRFDLQGSTIAFAPVGAVLDLDVRDNCEVFNGTLENAGSSFAGSGQYQSPIIIGNYGVGTGHDNIKLYNLTILSNRTNGNGIMVTGDSTNISIDNISFPASSTLARGILIHWGGAADVTSGTTHPSNINISNIYSNLNSNTSSDSAVVFLSATFNVEVSNVNVKDCSYRSAVTVFAGDYGAYYAPASYAESIMQNIKIYNVKANFISAECSVVKIACTSTLAPSNPKLSAPNVSNCSGIGIGTGATSHGIYVSGSIGGVIEKCTFSGFFHGIGFNVGVTGLKIRDSSLIENQYTGIYVSNSISQPTDCVIDNCVANLNNQIAGSNAGIYLGSCKRISIKNSDVGKTSETQNYGVRVDNTCTNALIENNYCADAVTVAFSVGSSTVYGLIKIFRDNLSEAGVQHYSGSNIIPFTEETHFLQPHRRFIGSAPPVGSAWNLGDTIYDVTPAAGGTIGWVCTTAGTPGTWKTFGAITA